MSIGVLNRLKLDELWWLVSPQNPLKPKAGMAPLEIRLRKAKDVARHPRIRPTAIETRLGTTRTVDTISALKKRFPQAKFLWLMGSDNLAQFHLWADWRNIARQVPIVVIARAPYIGTSLLSPAMGWLRQYRRNDPAGWEHWNLPAIGFIHLGLDPRSATQIRQHNPDWAQSVQPHQEIRI